MRVCVTCGVEQEDTEFYITNRRTGARRGQCRTCYQAAKKDQSLRVGKYGAKRRPGGSCTECGLPFSPEDFYVRKYRSDGSPQYWPQCKFCYQEYRRERTRVYVAGRYDERVRLIHAYLLEHSCVDCGETDPVILEFDHVRGEKEYAVSSMYTFSTHRIMEEIAKCEVRCRNCHFIRHQRDNRTRMWRLVHEGKL